jgi:hypothetical protein
VVQDAVQAKPVLRAAQVPWFPIARVPQEKKRVFLGFIAWFCPYSERRQPALGERVGIAFDRPFGTRLSPMS